MDFGACWGKKKKKEQTDLPTNLDSNFLTKGIKTHLYGNFCSFNKNITKYTVHIYVTYFFLFNLYLFTNLLELRERTDVNKMAQPVKVLAAKSDN